MIDTPDKRLYKIGSTRNSISKRIQSLQTGCPYEIKMVDYHESNYGQAVERTLQNTFEYQRTYGEWFELDLTEEVNFKSLCSRIESVNEILEKNNTI